MELIQGNPVFTEKQLNVEYQLAITLAMMGQSGTASSWLKMATKFGVGEGTIDVVTSRVIKVRGGLTFNSIEVNLVTSN